MSKGKLGWLVVWDETHLSRFIGGEKIAGRDRSYRKNCQRTYLLE